MMPTTPRGTRILPTWMPLGRRFISVIAPMGSGRAATWRRPSIMLWMVLSDSSKRSSSAGSKPLSRPRCISNALAALRAARWASKASAMAMRALFLVWVSAAAMTRDALRASRPRVVMYSMTDINVFRSKSGQYTSAHRPAPALIAAFVGAAALACQAWEITRRTSIGP